MLEKDQRRKEGDRTIYIVVLCRLQSHAGEKTASCHLWYAFAFVFAQQKEAIQGKWQGRNSISL